MNDMFGNEPPVRNERSGWRDEKISRRHRTWGFNCPAVDLDFLAVEYNIGLPVAIVEYKHWKAREPDTSHPTYRALLTLCDEHRRGSLPFLLAYYWPEFWGFRVRPLNTKAATSFKADEYLSELEYVDRLYRLRSLTVSNEVLARLNRERPEAA